MTKDDFKCAHIFSPPTYTDNNSYNNININKLIYYKHLTS